MNDLAEVKENGIVPRTMEELVKFSRMLAASELVPKDFQGKEANIFVAIQWGMEIGLHPMQAMQSIAVINGRPSLWGDAGLALVKASGLCDYFIEEIGADQTACRTRRKGEEHEQVRTFLKADAEKAGLWGKQGPWSSYPKRMLQMRARWWLLRDVYPDVLRGVHAAEEVQDVEIDVTPPGTAVQQPKSKTAPIDAEVVAASGKLPEEPPREEKKPEGPAAKLGELDAQTIRNNASSAANQPSGAKLSAGQLNIIRAKLKNAAMTEADLKAKYEVASIEDLGFADFGAIQTWIAQRGAAIAG